MTDTASGMPPPDSVARVKKMTVTPDTGEGFRSFARVEVEFVEEQLGGEGFVSSVSLSFAFKVDGLTLEQVKDFAILHEKRLMNRCATDPHLRVGDRRQQD